jgi:hypothetical protein
MNTMIKVLAISDKDKAGIAAAKLKLKNYTVEIHETTQVLMDATDLGDNDLILSDANKTVFVVVGIK